MTKTYGDMTVAGKITMTGTPAANGDVTTKAFMESAIGSAIAAIPAPSAGQVTGLTAAINAIVSPAIAAIIGGAPGSFDTFIEAFNAFEAHEDVVDGINTRLSSAETAIEALESGSIARYSGLIGNGVLTTFTVTHNLGNAYPLIQVYEVSTGEQVYPKITSVNATQCSIDFGTTVIPNNAMRVVAI